MRSTLQGDPTEEDDRATQHALLKGSSADHRRTVAITIGLPSDASARQVAANFETESGRRTVAESLSQTARELLTQAVFSFDGIALTVRPFELSLGERTFGFASMGRQRAIAANELERYGLAFAFSTKWELRYCVPLHLHMPLQSAVAVPFARKAKPATASRWLSAPRRDLEDLAAVWTSLARAPAPVKLDGKIHLRAKHRLLATLPPLDLADRDGALRSRRLELALIQLRDNGYLQLREEPRDAWSFKRELIATGDLASALGRDATVFDHFPSEGFVEGAPVTCARALGKVLAGRSVSLMSIGSAIGGLLEAAGQFAPRDSAPAEIALFGLFPGWLCGEVQLGLSPRGKLVAVRFEPVPERKLAGWCLETSPTTNGSGVPEADGGPAPNSEEPSYISTAAGIWSARAPDRASEYWWNEFSTRGTQISTLEPLHQVLASLSESPDF